MASSSPPVAPPATAAAAASNVYANESGVCCVPGCAATKAAGTCFVCSASTCCEHRMKVRVVARLGTVEPVHLCCNCLGNNNIWRPDETATQCFDCSRQFMLFRRRHHCRVCGNVFCGDCTKYRGAVNVTYPASKEVNVRMCLPCSDGLKRGLRCRAPTVIRRGNSNATVTGTPLSGTGGPSSKPAPAGRMLDGVMDIEETESVGSDVFDRFCRARDEFVSQSKSAAAVAHQQDCRARQARQSVVGATHLTPSVASNSSEADADERPGMPE